MTHTDLQQFELPPGGQTIDHRHNISLEDFIREYDMCVIPTLTFLIIIFLICFPLSFWFISIVLPSLTFISRLVLRSRWSSVVRSLTGRRTRFGRRRTSSDNSETTSCVLALVSVDRVIIIFFFLLFSFLLSDLLAPLQASRCRWSTICSTWTINASPLPSISLMENSMVRFTNKQTNKESKFFSCSTSARDAHALLDSRVLQRGLLSIPHRRRSSTLQVHSLYLSSFLFPSSYGFYLFILLLCRWVLMGPARTGPAFHVDPYLTPAWNAVVWGRKRW